MYRYTWPTMLCQDVYYTIIVVKYLRVECLLRIISSYKPHYYGEDIIMAVVTKIVPVYMTYVLPE